MSDAERTKAEIIKLLTMWDEESVEPADVCADRIIALIAPEIAALTAEVERLRGMPVQKAETLAELMDAVARLTAGEGT